VAVVSLLDPLPLVTADLIRSLRAADGSAPCPDGLAAGLRWLGDRALPLEEALEELRRSRRGAREYVGWALAALGYGDGSGSGYGSGSGSGYGYGSGSGYGYGYGSGSGSGYGDGSGSGYGYGDGSGYGDGDGYGYGDGSGYGDGDGDGYGDGYGSRYGDGELK
jgi:hypothetical protein